MKESSKVDEVQRPSQEGHSARALIARRLPQFLEPISRLGEHPIRVVEPYIGKGRWVADLGCGWGYYSFVLASLVGPEGKVFAVDLDETCIRSIQKKIDKKGNHNIEARATSAANLDFIDDQTIDLVFANGLLCSMASDRLSAVSEMKRILKPTGKAYLTGGTAPRLSFLTEEEWQEILDGFTIIDSAPNKEAWTLVSLKPETV